MSLSIDSNVGVPAGVAVGGAAGFLGGAVITNVPFTRDAASVAGAMVGEKFNKLPVAPKLVAGIKARSMAREFIASNPKLAALPKPAQEFLLDGVATRVGIRMNDPNKMLDAFETVARTGAEEAAQGVGKLVPKFGEEAQAVARAMGEAIEFTRGQGVRSVNAATGARWARAAPALLLGIGGAVIGGMIGAALTTPPLRINTPEIKRPDLNIQR